LGHGCGPRVCQAQAKAPDRPWRFFERLIHAAGDSTGDDQMVFERLIHAAGDSTGDDQTLSGKAGPAQARDQAKLH